MLARKRKALQMATQKSTTGNRSDKPQPSSTAKKWSDSRIGDWGLVSRHAREAQGIGSNEGTAQTSQVKTDTPEFAAGFRLKGKAEKCFPKIEGKQ